MEGIILIPNEVLRLIPVYNGDRQLLNLFIRKCEYVISKFEGDYRQNEYVLHAITSRLTGEAAVLISERYDVSTWEELKELFLQHFGDSRSEENIATELELLKIERNEDYLNFCNRIRTVLTKLTARISKMEDRKLKEKKIVNYNTTALNVFLYNLPQNLVHVVRVRAPKSLEDALSVVLEEASFQERYNMHHRTINRNVVHQTFQPGFNSFSQNCTRFGSTQAQPMGLFGSSTATSQAGMFATSSTMQRGLFGSPQQQLFGCVPLSQNTKAVKNNTNDNTLDTECSKEFGKEKRFSNKDDSDNEN